MQGLLLLHRKCFCRFRPFLYARIRAGGGCRGMQRGLEGTFLREIGCK